MEKIFLIGGLLSVLYLQGLQAIEYTSQALSDQITSLPGTESYNVTFNQFSGYLTIPGKTNELL